MRTGSSSGEVRKGVIDELAEPSSRLTVELNRLADLPRNCPVRGPVRLEVQEPLRTLVCDAITALDLASETSRCVGSMNKPLD